MKQPEPLFVVTRSTVSTESFQNTENLDNLSGPNHPVSDLIPYFQFILALYVFGIKGLNNIEWVLATRPITFKYPCYNIRILVLGYGNQINNNGPKFYYQLNSTLV